MTAPTAPSSRTLPTPRARSRATIASGRDVATSFLTFMRGRCAMPKKRMNWAQVRHAIDSGLTGDKVAWPDPPAAPLGTDEEAGGFTTPGEDIAACSTTRQDGRDRSAPDGASRDPPASSAVQQ